MTGATLPPAAGLPGRAAGLIAAQLCALTAATGGCDAVVAASPKEFAARPATEKPGIRDVYASYQPATLPSPHHSPRPMEGRSFPPEVTDNRVLWDLNAQS